MTKELPDNYIRHGNHYILGENDGYVYCYYSSEGYSLESHLHDCYEFVYITDGHCIYTIEGREYFVSPGDLIFTRPNELHSFSFPEKCTFTRQFIHVYPDYIKAFPEISGIFHEKEYAAKNFIPANVVEEYGLDKIFNTLKSYTNESLPETFIIAYSKVLELMAKTIEIMRTVDISQHHAIKNKTIYKILRYIDEHFAENITLEDVADELYLSNVYISRVFKQELGLNLKTHINMRRIVMAKNMIAANEKISSVYTKCGFENYSTFYRSFMRFVGMSPDEFKQRIEKAS